MKKILKHIIYPVTLILAMTMTYWGLMHHYSVEIVLPIIMIFVNSFIWFLEYQMPFRLDWRPNLKTLSIDIIYTLSNAKILTPILKISILWLLNKFHFLSFDLWPKSQYFFIQLILAILIGDFLIYWLHRWMHLTKIGWRIHVIHHTPAKLHFWASARSHPLNVIFVYTTEVGVLTFLGADIILLSVWTVFMSVNGLFQHCNIDIKTTYLNRVLATCEVHRLHHSNDWKLSNSNFGNTTVFWDQLFGTYLRPNSKITEVGIKMHKIPENYFAQLALPLNLDQYKIE